ncbi:MAG: AAA family ATPase, partial [Verrucomicrobiota bacterium]
LLQHGTDIIPIEVKAGTTGQMRSLHLLMALRGWPRAVRFNADYPSMTTVTATTHDKNNHQYQLLSLPFYFIGQLSRLLDEE